MAYLWYSINVSSAVRLSVVLFIAMLSVVLFIVMLSVVMLHVGMLMLGDANKPLCQFKL